MKGSGQKKRLARGKSFTRIVVWVLCGGLSFLEARCKHPGAVRGYPSLAYITSSLDSGSN